MGYILLVNSESSLPYKIMSSLRKAIEPDETVTTSSYTSTIITSEGLHYPVILTGISLIV
ncbi:MAG: hypothetical protein ACFFAE_14320 [Candidatus Hodarchaeota archaeon]